MNAHDIHKAMLARIEILMDSTEGTPEAQELSALAAACEAYEGTMEPWPTARIAQPDREAVARIIDPEVYEKDSLVTDPHINLWRRNLACDKADAILSLLSVQVDGEQKITPLTKQELPWTVASVPSRADELLRAIWDDIEFAAVEAPTGDYNPKDLREETFARLADFLFGQIPTSLSASFRAKWIERKESDPEGTSRTETAGWQPIESAVADHVVLVCNPDEGTLPVVAMKVEDTWYQHDLRGTALTPAPKFWMRWPKMPRSTEAVADTDADAQRDDGLLSGVSSDPINPGGSS